MTKLKSVAIIGGGAAGLCTARHLIHRLNNNNNNNNNNKNNNNNNSNGSDTGVHVKAVVFEQRDVLGGTWAYEDIDAKKPNSKLFSSIYANLR